MGAVNYFTSEYITIGFDPNYNENDFDSWDEMEEQKQLDCEDVENEVENLIDQNDFYFYHVTVKPGYYEGFTIDIENNFGIAYNDREEKREAQKEITALKKFLLYCANLGLVQVFPGWCTAYKTHDETVKAIAAAISEMRIEAKETPTFYTLEKKGEI